MYQPYTTCRQLGSQLIGPVGAAGGPQGGVAHAVQDQRAIQTSIVQASAGEQSRGDAVIRTQRGQAQCGGEKFGGGCRLQKLVGVVRV